MGTPGSNLLNQAMCVISKQKVLYFRATGRETKRTGLEVTAFAEGVIKGDGSFQPVDTAKYAFMGLDLAKSYSYWWVPYDVKDLQRDISADQVEFGGRRWQIESGRNWYLQDGWKKILCVDIGEANA